MVLRRSLEDAKQDIRDLRGPVHDHEVPAVLDRDVDLRLTADREQAIGGAVDGDCPGQSRCSGPFHDGSAGPAEGHVLLLEHRQGELPLRRYQSAGSRRANSKGETGPIGLSAAMSRVDAIAHY